MQYVAAAEKAGELVKDIAAFSRANPWQASLNKFSAYQAAREIGSDFRMARRYISKYRRRFRRYRRKGLRLAGRRFTGKRKRWGKPMSTKRKRMIHTKPSGKAMQDLTWTGDPFVGAYGQLYVSLMPNPAAPSDASSFNVREQANVFYKGYKLCRYFENNFVTAPIVVSYAIIQWEDQVYDRILGNGGTTIENAVKTNFFRDRSGFADRQAAFFDYNQTGSTPWLMAKNCLSINPNRGFRIITHKKKVLYPRYPRVDVSETGASVFDGGRPWYWKIDRYLKVNKNLQFATRQIAHPNTPFMEIFWCNTLSPRDHPVLGAGNLNGLVTYKTHQLYFSEPN